jgi:hypothetical protein
MKEISVEIANVKVKNVPQSGQPDENLQRGTW